MRYWLHGQNLKKDEQHIPRWRWLWGRAWVKDRKSHGELGIEWALPTSHCHWHLDIGGHQQFALGFACYLFSLHFHLDGCTWLRWHVFNDWRGREIGWTWFAWSLSWHVWTPPDEWSSKTPRWREGHFNLPDFLFGRYICSRVEQEPIAALVPMPEGDYPATVRFFTQTWQRSRFPYTKRRSDAHVDVEGGIPIPGKGESAWDCDDSAFLSIGSSATTVEGAIADAIDCVNRRRERYGGRNWRPAKAVQ